MKKNVAYFAEDSILLQHGAQREDDKALHIAGWTFRSHHDVILNGSAEIIQNVSLLSLIETICSCGESGACCSYSPSISLPVGRLIFRLPYRLGKKPAPPARGFQVLAKD